MLFTALRTGLFCACLSAIAVTAPAATAHADDDGPSTIGYGWNGLWTGPRGIVLSEPGRRRFRRSERVTATGDEVVVH